jgi:hypothetical protein
MAPSPCPPGALSPCAWKNSRRVTINHQLSTSTRLGVWLHWAFPIGFPPAMELGSEALPTPLVQPPGEPGYRQRRFRTDSGGQTQLGHVALGPLLQITLRPTQPPQLFPDVPFGSGFAGRDQTTTVCSVSSIFYKHCWPLPRMGLRLQPQTVASFPRKLQWRVSIPAWPHRHSPVSEQFPTRTLDHWPRHYGVSVPYQPVPTQWHWQNICQNYRSKALFLSIDRLAGKTHMHRAMAWPRL